MTALPEKKSELPPGVVLEKPSFVPRMAMTDELRIVANEVIHQWRHRKDFIQLAKYGIRPLDRLLFYGPPGNGKTIACYWMAKELGIPIYRVLCNNLHGSYLGETTKAIGEVMDFLNSRIEPALCLWDEVEAIFVDRKRIGSSGSSRELGTALTVFMQMLDRWKAPTLMVMATNLVASVDEALLSRVEMRLEFIGPTAEQCEQVIGYWCELLHDHGSQEWGPSLLERFRQDQPFSFRELQQAISRVVRDWIAKRCGKGGAA